MRAVITGATGFVGQHLSRHLLANGDDVVSIDRDHDVTDLDDLASVFESARPEVVYHLAALSHVGASWDDPSDVLRVNVLGTNCVLTAARRTADTALIVVVSSAEVYGVVDPRLLPLAESAPLAPTSPYAASKAAAELVALQAHRGFGQRVVVVRPFNHIGPGQSSAFFVPALASRLVAAKEKGETEVAVGTLTARRDFTDVRDVVRAYRLLATNGTSGEVYNVASGRDCVLFDVATKLRLLAHPEARFIEDPALMRPVEVPALRGDASKLLAATGWTPEISLDDTLRDIVQAEREHQA